MNYPTNCPMCKREMECVGENTAASHLLFHCPRCGTFQEETKKPIVPLLVVRATEMYHASALATLVTKFLGPIRVIRAAWSGHPQRYAHYQFQKFGVSECLPHPTK